MRALLTLGFCGVIAAPGAALAQTLIAPPLPAVTEAPRTLAPFPTLDAATRPAAVETAPPPPRAEAAPQPELATEAPTTVAPVLVETAEKDNKLGKAAVGAVGGVVGGLAGAAVAGPVGKFAGSFVGKRVVKGLVGEKDDGIPEVQVAITGEQAAAAAALGEAPRP